MLGKLISKEEANAAPVLAISGSRRVRRDTDAS
jgi:hypothetical protein